MSSGAHSSGRFLPSVGDAVVGEVSEGEIGEVGVLVGNLDLSIWFEFFPVLNSVGNRSADASTFLVVHKVCGVACAR